MGDGLRQNKGIMFYTKNVVVFSKANLSNY